MGESKVKDGNYYVVQSFMVKNLKLKGLEKDVYAIIYGFSQTSGQVFNGSLQYLCDWTFSSKQGVMNALKKLVDKGLIDKKEVFLNGVKFVEYYASELDGSKESCMGVSNKVDGGGQQSCIGGMQQSLPNNIVLNNIDNNKDNNIEKETYKENRLLSKEEIFFNQFWEAYPKKVNKKGAYNSFKKIKNLDKIFDTIMISLERFKKSQDWLKQNGQFIPHPQTWINQERWKDQNTINERQEVMNDLDMSDWL